MKRKIINKLINPFLFWVRDKVCDIPQGVMSPKWLSTIYYWFNEDLRAVWPEPDPPTYGEGFLGGEVGNLIPTFCNHGNPIDNTCIECYMEAVAKMSRVGVNASKAGERLRAIIPEAEDNPCSTCESVDIPVEDHHCGACLILGLKYYQYRKPNINTHD